MQPPSRVRLTDHRLDHPNTSIESIRCFDKAFIGFVCGNEGGELLTEVAKLPNLTRKSLFPWWCRFDGRFNCFAPQKMAKSLEKIIRENFDGLEAARHQCGSLKAWKGKTAWHPMKTLTYERRLWILARASTKAVLTILRIPRRALLLPRDASGFCSSGSTRMHQPSRNKYGYHYGLNLALALSYCFLVGWTLFSSRGPSCSTVMHYSVIA